MKKLILLTLFLMFAVSSLSAQVLMVEEFDYPAGDTLNDHGWYGHSQPNVNPVFIVSGSLSYPGYVSSDIGNKATLIGGSGSREDLTRVFEPDSVSNVYASFLAKIISASTTADYIFHFREHPVDAILRGRIHIQDDGSGLNFKVGLTKQSTSVIEYYPSVFPYGTTMLFVLKYNYVEGADNDFMQLWVNPTLPGSEPPADLTTVDAASDIIVNAVSLRQGSRVYEVDVDGIRVANSWYSLPLPVELTSFKGSVIGNSVNLNWSTVTETNNKGFEIERKSSQNNYQFVGFAEGSGSSSSPLYYSFTDSRVANGKYTYRLKQIDFDGSFSYSSEIELEVVAPITFGLSQNYPNPFNPSTIIDYSVSAKSQVSLIVYDLLGNQVAELVNDVKDAGNYSASFNASGLSSGVYFYKLSSAGQTITKKLTLMK